ncbi:MAG: hypothetical protein KatS3mg110_1922 [Pirellulaceae bacterium]|nr:MAG: hypothetical protein KatS3mg110_1922 [Pirellulaceae bacterium]
MAKTIVSRIVHLTGCLIRLSYCGILFLYCFMVLFDSSYMPPSKRVLAVYFKQERFTLLLIPWIISLVWKTGRRFWWSVAWLMLLIIAFSAVNLGQLYGRNHKIEIMINSSWSVWFVQMWPTENTKPILFPPFLPDRKETK